MRDGGAMPDMSLVRKSDIQGKLEAQLKQRRLFHREPRKTEKQK